LSFDETRSEPATSPPARLFEDFVVGLTFHSAGAATLTAEQIRSFAAEFDPQPFHLSAPEVAEDSVFGGLVASGWHTAAVAMRLIVDSDLGLHGQAVGLAVESLRWRAPVRPGDTLRMEGTVTDARPSRSRSDGGVVRFHVLLRNQKDQVVLEGDHVVLVRRRAGSAPR
jgi:acyl dehydratase